MLDSMVDAVGIEPTTCRLRAVEFADPPAAIGCYKLLSFVHFADSPFPPIATYTPQIMPYFEVEWAQKWVQFTEQPLQRNAGLRVVRPFPQVYRSRFLEVRNARLRGALSNSRARRVLVTKISATGRARLRLRW